MATLLERLTGPAEIDSAEAWRQYRQLLERNDKPKQGDEEALRQLMARLDLTAADVQQHLDAIAKVHDLDAKAADAEHLAEVAADASSKWNAHEDETKRIIAQREDEEANLRQRMNQTRDAHQRAVEAQRSANEMKIKHRELFGLPPAEPDPKPRFPGAPVQGPQRSVADKAARYAPQQGAMPSTPIPDGRHGLTV